jgi:hypothetical protein
MLSFILIASGIVEQKAKKIPGLCTLIPMLQSSVVEATN